MAVTKTAQIMEGTRVHGMTVTGEQPYRDTSGRLVWDCACAQGHKVALLHSDLAAGHVVCANCQEPALKKALGHGESDAEFKEWAALHRVVRQKRPVSDAPDAP